MQWKLISISLYTDSHTHICAWISQTTREKTAVKKPRKPPCTGPEQQAPPGGSSSCCAAKCKPCLLRGWDGENEQPIWGKRTFGLSPFPDRPRRLLSWRGWGGWSEGGEWMFDSNKGGFPGAHGPAYEYMARTDSSRSYDVFESFPSVAIEGHEDELSEGAWCGRLRYCGNDAAREWR